MPSNKSLLASASQFDVYKWSDYPEIKQIVDDVFDEVVRLRRSRRFGVRITGKKQIKKHLRILLINLYVSFIGFNPWIGVAKRKPDYKKVESRYRKIFLTFDYLIPLVNDLVSLGYVKEARGFYDAAQGRGMRTRIRARAKLIQLIEDAKYGLVERIAFDGLSKVVVENPDAERETIILRDAKKKNIEYEDTDETCLMRENLRAINSSLLQASITLPLTDEQSSDLRRRLLRSHNEDREPIDFSHVTLARVFNEDFEHGGRFYGGWWIGLPKEYRGFIKIDGEPTSELDYSGHHISILYWMEDDMPEPELYFSDHYEVIDFDHAFRRSDIKIVLMIMLNAVSKPSTISACRLKGVSNAIDIIEAIEVVHRPIAHHFYTGIGTRLQNLDSKLAEQVMLKMIEQGVTVLPIHDSFIVKESEGVGLEEVMEEVFMEMFDNHIPTIREG